MGSEGRREGGRERGGRKGGREGGREGKKRVGSEGREDVPVKGLYDSYLLSELLEKRL